jgi:hypothetical protein
LSYFSICCVSQTRSLRASEVAGVIVNDFDDWHVDRIGLYIVSWIGLQNWKRIRINGRLSEGGRAAECSVSGLLAGRNSSNWVKNLETLLGNLAH